jgi:hypothetical protein
MNCKDVEGSGHTYIKKLDWRHVVMGTAGRISGLWTWTQTQDFPNTNLKNLLLSLVVQLKLYCIKFHACFVHMIIQECEIPHWWFIVTSNS